MIILFHFHEIFQKNVFFKCSPNFFLQGSSDEPEMTKLNEAITEQKDIVMKCLESDQCDINTLNEQLEILQTMQQK